MKKIIVTYDARETGESITGEAAAKFLVGDHVAYVLSNSYDAFLPNIERALREIGFLREREYVLGSVKKIEVIV